jgi:hypothetical protein
MTENASSMLSSSKSTIVNRKQLAQVICPPETDTFKPIPHIRLVESIEKVLNRRHINIVKEQFAISHNGQRLFSTLDLAIRGIKGTRACMGLRTSNDKSMPLQIVVGVRVFVCDNMALNGDFIALRRKHTSGLKLMQELRGGIDRYEAQYKSLQADLRNLQDRTLSDMEAKALILDVFNAEDSMPLRFIHDVTNEYFKPRHAEFEPRNAWSLHNAFTEVAKQLPINTRMRATMTVGRIFGLLPKGAENN